MSESKILPIRATLSGRWQFPLLLIATVLLGSSLYRVAAAHQTVTIEDQFNWVQELRASGALTRAHSYVLYLLKDVERPLDQQAELYRLLAGTIQQAETPFRVHKPDNIQSIIKNFRSAIRYGAKLAAVDWKALGDAYRWDDRTDEAIDAYRQSLRLDPPYPERIHRTLVELQVTPGHPVTAEVMFDLDFILKSEDATPSDTHWALEQKIYWLLSQGQIEAALALVDEGAQRLAGTGERLSLTYLRALCLRVSGKRLEAETLLRSLRNNWSGRDGLWGSSGWLLGRLEQEEGRPQSALTFYDDVMMEFPSGDLHVACLLGRSECLAMLGRYERSLETFDDLTRRLFGTESDSASDRPSTIAPTRGVGGEVSAPFYRMNYFDRDAIRNTITTIGQSRLQEGETELGIRFMRLALRLVPESKGDLRSHYVSQIAAGFVALASEKAAGHDVVSSTAGAPEARALNQQAAEMYLAEADMHPLDEVGTAKAMELAADNFDGAGMSAELIGVLTRLIREHPAYPGRADAMYRLGRAYQAQRDFPRAIRHYRQVIKEYARLPAALDSMVPLAESLLELGQDDVTLGVKRLIDIVEDRGPDPLFNPQAREYRQALIRLAEFYSRTSEAQTPGHFEKAITRWEDAIALYPNDPQMPRMTFLLADAYQQSAQQILSKPETGNNEAAQREIRRRLRAAFTYYIGVKSFLAPQDYRSLTDLERTYLRASYSNIGDCLFDLRDYERAIEAYREAAWRYENEPIAVSATMQVVHCYRRLGRSEEARAALARLQWLLKKLPAESFDTQRGMSSKTFWEGLVKRMELTGIN